MLRFLFFSLISFPLFSLPQGAIPISGEAQLSLSSPQVLDILAGDRSIIEWSDFSIETGETVRFTQPHAGASVLNRVMEAYPSRLLGKLEANGQVLLINPNGIVVGKNAQIDTGSLIASTLDIQNQDYLSQNTLTFKGVSSASLIIEGKIQAAGGVIALISGQIKQSGSLHANEVHLLSGSEVLFGSHPKIVGAAPFSEEKSLILQEGFIEAPFVEILALTESYCPAIYHSGTIAATSATLHADGGLNWIDGAISSNSGSLQVLGERIGLGDTAYLDVSGVNGGGKIFIGGDFQGKNRDAIPAATEIYVSSMAKIFADALERGDGGRVIVWGDDANIFYGNISAQGGPLGGNGGFVEVSSPKHLDFQGLVSTLAPLGKLGTLLLDPTNITINNAVTSANITFGGICGAGTFCPTGGVAGNIEIGTGACLSTCILQNLIGNNVTINSAPGGGGGAGNVIIANTITFTAAQTGNLTINAAGTIAVNAAITNMSATTGLTLNATGALTISAAINYRPGATGVLNLLGNGITINGTIDIGVTLPAPPPPPFLNTTTSPVTLISTGNININSRILHWSVGDVVLIAPSLQTITINGVAVGSVNGRNFIGDPNLARCIRGRPDVVLIGGGNGAIFGFYPSSFMPVPFTAQAPIDVTCNNLTLRAGPTAFDSASIGHTAFGANTANTLAAATITVDAANNILLQSGNTTTSAQIGHGGQFNQSGAFMQGDICVTAGGSICLQHPLVANAVRCVAQIGHGNGLISPSVSANITVEAAGDIRLEDLNTAVVTEVNVPANSWCAIGHGSATNSPGNPRDGNISVICGGDLTLHTVFTNPTAPEFYDTNVFIGHNIETIAGNTPDQSATNLFVSVGGDLTINANSTLNTQIGTTATTITGGALEILVQGNFCVSSGNGTNNVPTTRVIVGNLGTILVAPRDTNIAVQGNLSITPCQAVANAIGCCTACPVTSACVSCPACPSPNCQGLGQAIQFTAPRDFNLAVEGNIDATGTGFVPLLPANLLLSYISTATLTTGSTRVRAGGHIRAVAGNNLTAAYPVNSTNYFLIGYNTPSPPTGAATPPPLFTTGSLLVQAGADLQMLNGFNTGSGLISMGSGVSFAAGDLWTLANNQIDTICGLLATPIPITACATCLLDPVCNIFCRHPVIPIGAASAAIAGSCTCLNFNSAVNQNSAFFQTVTTPITFTSNTCVDCAGCGAVGAPSILLGTGIANTLQIHTTSGALTVAGFSSITVRQVLTTASNVFPAILLDACNNITVEAANTLNVTGAGSIEMTAGNAIIIDAAITTNGGPITILSDVDSSGSGDLTISQSITSADGSIFLQAGADNGCSGPIGPSFSHTGGAINSGAGDLTVNANFNINLSSLSNPSLTTTTGTFHTEAGHDTTLTNTTISKTGGGGAQDLLMISGRNLTLINSHILANLAFVTLVVDNCFPTMPLIGPGKFNLDANSSIDPVNLRIFTALRSQNTISGTLNLNGNTFVPGTLYEDTATEHWCQYFGFPFPYPFSSLGNDPLFTIFYKDCLGQAVNQAQIIVDQFLVELHPYNEFPGWMAQFWIEFKKSPSNRDTSISSLMVLDDEPFYLRRRHLNIINQPKTWTIWND